jgi:4-hydroxy-4-methyl-2-oxoglutarate aldolase
MIQRLKIMRLDLFASLIIVISLCVCSETPGSGKSSSELHQPEGILHMKNKSFNDSDETRKILLDLYKDLRTADVSDAMDRVGLPDVGVMADYIKPLWKDTESYKHVICGFAFTMRYLPTNKVPPNPHPDNDYMPYQKMWYGTLAGSFWKDSLRPGDLIVMDAHECYAGLVGSNNSMEWRIKGAVGVITNDGPRDTDEIIAMKYPIYCRRVNYGTNIARAELESWNRPVNCGGVVVFPGDMVVADGDGVVVVPRERTLEVGKVAREIFLEDEKSRAEKYKQLNLKIDERVKDL